MPLCLESRCRLHFLPCIGAVEKSVKGRLIKAQTVLWSILSTKQVSAQLIHRYFPKYPDKRISADKVLQVLEDDWFQLLETEGDRREKEII